jgi:hypothetical protein
MQITEDTIVALSTPPGVGAIGVIRLSGKDSIIIADQVFKGKKLQDQSSHTLHFGSIREGDDIIDEVVVGIFQSTTFLYERRCGGNILPWLAIHPAKDHPVADPPGCAGGKGG